MKLFSQMSNYLKLLIVVLFFQSSSAIAQKYHRKMPYSKSKLIKKLEWSSEPYKYPGTASDMHWWTWGIDDSIYTLEDDGDNFGGPYWYAHILKVDGIPPNHTVKTVTDFEGYDFRDKLPKQLLLRYVCGLVAVDSNMYVCLYDYDWNLPSKTTDFDYYYKKMKVHKPWMDVDSSKQDALSFINKYSKLGGVAAIIKSKDGGKTWSNIPDENTPQLFPPEFGAPAFLTFGKGNTETPKSLDPYVFAVSNDINWASGDNVRLGRVHRDSIIDKSAWKFYNGLTKSGEPKWIDKADVSKPIFTDPGHVGHPTITYNKALDRYFLIISSDSYPHVETDPIEVMHKWDIASELQIYESKNIWGPWKIFHSEKPWGGNNHTNYLAQMPSKWLSSDGLSGSIVFAGDYTRDGAHYGFMTQSFKLLLRRKK